jgi:hypothetical protein
LVSARTDPLGGFKGDAERSIGVGDGTTDGNQCKQQDKGLSYRFSKLQL